MNSDRRLKKDFAALKKYIFDNYEDDDAVLFPNCKEGASFDSAFSDMRKFTILMKGPKNSPYENGLFEFETVIPNDFPMKPPRIQCKTEIYHPNINKNYVCVETLSTGWSPTLGLKQVFMSIYAVMFTPHGSENKNPVKKLTEKDFKSHDRFLKKASDTTARVSNAQAIVVYNPPLRQLTNTKECTILIVYDKNIEKYNLMSRMSTVIAATVTLDKL
jgi:ubiquitin-conjugating enzyme E2 N